MAAGNARSNPRTGAARRHLLNRKVSANPVNHLFALFRTAIIGCDGVSYSVTSCHPSAPS